MSWWRPSSTPSLSC